MTHTVLICLAIYVLGFPFTVTFVGRIFADDEINGLEVPLGFFWPIILPCIFAGVLGGQLARFVVWVLRPGRHHASALAPGTFPKADPQPGKIPPPSGDD